MKSTLQCENMCTTLGYVKLYSFSNYIRLLKFKSALTDPLISGIAKGSKAYKLIGSFVSTPLNWYSEATELLVYPSCIRHTGLLLLERIPYTRKYLI